MTEEETLNNFYPSMAQPASQLQQAGSVLGGATTDPVTPKTPTRIPTRGEELKEQARAEGVCIGSMPDEHLAEAFYAPDGLTNDPPASYEPNGVYTFYEGLEKEARMINDEEQIAVLQEARKATNEAFREFDVHPTRAQELMIAASDYYKNPRSAADNEQKTEIIMTKLRGEYGRKTEAVIASAQRVASELCKKIPEFGNLLARGLGSDEKFIKTCISIGKRRGYTKK